MIEDLLLGTCAFVFVVTSIITLLGITNLIKIEKIYLNKLFYALILEFIAVVLFWFSDSLFGEKRECFVRMTSPLYDISMQRTNSVSINGVAVLSSKDTLRCKVIQSGKYNYIDTSNIFLTAIGEHDLFVFNQHIDTTKLPIDVFVTCLITNNGEIKAKDREVKITLK